MQFWISVSWHVRSTLRVRFCGVSSFQYSPNQKFIDFLNQHLSPWDQDVHFIWAGFGSLYSWTARYPDNARELNYFRVFFPQNQICGMIQLFQLQFLSVRQMMHGVRNCIMHEIRKSSFHLYVRLRKPAQNLREGNWPTLFFNALLLKHFPNKLITQTWVKIVECQATVHYYTWQKMIVIHHYMLHSIF